MICSNCATELPAGALFCGECGRPVSARTAAVSLPAAVDRESQPAEPQLAESQPAEPEPAAELVSPVEPVRGPASVSADWNELDNAVASSLPPVVASPAARLDESPSADAPATTQAESAPAEHPDPLPRAPRDPYDEALGAEVLGAGWCAQCGALLSASDIFCGECGFVRSPSSRPRDTAVLDPFPWGISSAQRAVPSAEPAAHPSEAGPVATTGATTSSDPAEDVDDTRLVAPGPRAERFVLQFSTGESVTVAGAGLLGRNPMPEPGEYFDALVTISDPGKSVSKTHLEFGQEGGAFWVSDRYSGNGTIVREPDRPSRRCEPGKRYRIARGTRVDIGEQFFVVS